MAEFAPPVDPRDPSAVLGLPVESFEVTETMEPAPEEAVAPTNLPIHDKAFWDEDDAALEAALEPLRGVRTLEANPEQVRRAAALALRVAMRAREIVKQMALEAITAVEAPAKPAPEKPVRKRTPRAKVPAREDVPTVPLVPVVTNVA